MKLMEMKKIRDYVSKKICKFRDTELLGNNIEMSSGQESNIFYKMNGKEYHLKLSVSEKTFNEWQQGVTNV